MKGRALTARTVALLSAGAAAVHQLRYAVGYGHDATHALAAQGHAYLSVLLPFVAAGAFVAVAAMLRTPLAGRPLSLRRAWVVAFVVLVVGYCAQELLEGLLTSGHPAGLGGVFGSGGWVALPFAAVVAGLVALGLRGGGVLVAAPAEPLVPDALHGDTLVLAAPILRIRGGTPRRLSARGPPLLTIG